VDNLTRNNRCGKRRERIERDEREKTKKGKLMILIGGEDMSNNEQSFKRAPNVRRKIKRYNLDIYDHKNSFFSSIKLNIPTFNLLYI